MAVDFEEKFKALDWEFKAYSKGWLISCPNKDWHKNGDKHYSCVVWPNVNWFRCYGCGRQGRLPKLFDGTGQELSEYWSMGVKYERAIPENVELDEEILCGFRHATVSDLQWLNRSNPKREWGQEHINTFDLRYDERHSNVVFPVRSPKLVGAVGRNVNKKIVHNYFGFMTGRSLGGLDKINNEHPSVLVVEGWTCLVNCHAWAAEMGFDVVCTFTANVTPHQIEMLSDLCKPLIFAFDQDKAGRHGVSKAADMLDGTVFVRKWNPGMGDVGSMSRETFLTVLEN